MKEAQSKLIFKTILLFIIIYLIEIFIFLNVGFGYLEGLIDTWFPLIVDIIISAIYYYKHSKDIQSDNYVLSVKHYTERIAPQYSYYVFAINISADDMNNLGGTHIQYFFVGDHNKYITFPESKYGNKQKFYLTWIDFDPNYDRQGATENNETPSYALLTLVNAKTHRTIRITLNDVYRRDVLDIKKHCELGLSERKQLGI